MYEITRFLAATAPKVKKVRKAPVKAIKVGAAVILFNDGNTYTVAERDTRYKNAWFITNAEGVRAPCSVGRDMLQVIG